ncbi:MAG: hypothetical protein HYY17_05225 [Planctomycetes bacterium]|nr:hypothetical protein [Planctomycetota bacterium]
MYVPDEGTASETLADFYGEYAIARLLADDRARKVGEGLQKAQEGLRKADDEERAAARSATRALAVRDAADARLDAAVRDLWLEARRLSGNKNEAPLMKALFPTGLNPIIRASTEDEPVRVGSLLKAVEEAGRKELTALVPGVVSAKDGFVRQAKAHADAEAAHDQAFAAERVRRLDWIRAYTGVYGTLVEMLGSKSEADDFFRSPGRRSRAAVTQPPGEKGA